MQLFIALLIGTFAGIIAALCGVGGGLIMVPAFILILKMPEKNAISTSLAAIIFTALATSAKNHSNALIDWKIALSAGIAGAVAGWSMADLMKKLHDVTLTRIFATLLIVIGIQMWVQSINKQNLSKSKNPTFLSNHKKI